MDICNYDSCTGCATCFNACTHDAIQMNFDKEGFLRPLIDEKKCINCGVCIKKCPANNDIIINDKISPLNFALINKDSESLKKSASGGAFKVFADYVLRKKGIVYGAVYDKKTKYVYIKAAHNQEELQPMLGSKYVQSIVGKSYKKVKSEIRKGTLVLFSGLPCQVAGLLAYLHKPYDNLLTIDLVCHGAPSSGIFKSFLEWKEKQVAKQIANVQHRYKNRNWNVLIQLTSFYEYIDNSKEIHKWQDDPFLLAFNSWIMNRKSCYKCKFATIPRTSDITIGDFFGLGTITRNDLDCKRGVSSVIVNTEKGKKYYEAINSEVISQERTLYESLFYNHNLWKPTKEPLLRDIFYQDFKNYGWDYLRKKYLDKNFKREISIKIHSFIKSILGPDKTVKLMRFIYLRRGIDKKVRQIIDNLQYEKINKHSNPLLQ